MKWFDMALDRRISLWRRTLLHGACLFVGWLVSLNLEMNFWVCIWLFSLNLEMNFWVCILSSTFDIHRFKICSNETGQKGITKLLS